MKKILLALRGKRIVATKTVESEDGNFDWVESVYPDTDSRKYKLIDYNEEQFVLAKTPFSYYDERAKKVKPMQKVIAQVDKTSIENDGTDYVTYVLKTNEPMDVVIQQEIGGNRENLILPQIPDGDGYIKLEIDSNVLGTIRISAIGDTKYTDTLEVSVV